VTPSVPFRPQAVVFDLDGLLLDSEPLWAAAEASVVTSFGGAWDAAVQQRMHGKGPDDAAQVLAEHAGVADVREVKRRLRAAAEAEFRKGAPLRPGAARLLSGLAGRLPLGVATNSSRELAELALTAAGIAGHFATVITADDVARPKPAPDPYATACERLGAEPGCSLALEDSAVGAASAAAAGLWVIGCPSLPGTELDAAHTVVDSLHEVDAARLLAAA
jgi:HAD superfamily hydrolase (TIGR01509 family)